MDIEKLKKLTRLANNNSNDHEANLAARKVCKMLEEANWILTSTPPPPPRTHVVYDETVGFEDIFAEMLRNQARQKAERMREEERVRQQAQENIRRQQEQARKQAAEEQAKRQHAAKFQEFNQDEWFQNFKDHNWVNRRTGEILSHMDYEVRRQNAFEEAVRRQRTYYSSGSSTVPPEPPDYSWSEAGYPFEFTRSGGNKRDRPIRKLKCVKCGKEQETKYMGTIDTFMCWSCWYP